MTVEVSRVSKDTYLQLIKKRAVEESFKDILERYRESVGEWDMESYDDAGENWQEDSELYCECGRKLRYRYGIIHQKTGEVLHFGIHHLQLHTGFPDSVARAMQQAETQGTFEKSEVEERLEEEWVFPGKIHEEFIADGELLQLALRHGYPLTKKMERELRSQLAAFHNERKQVYHRNYNLDELMDSYRHAERPANDGEFSLFSDSVFIETGKMFELKQGEQILAYALWSEGVRDIEEIAEVLHVRFSAARIQEEVANGLKDAASDAFRYQLTGRTKYVGLVGLFVKDMQNQGLLAV